MNLDASPQNSGEGLHFFRSPDLPPAHYREPLARECALLGPLRALISNSYISLSLVITPTLRTHARDTVDQGACAHCADQVVAVDAYLADADGCKAAPDKLERLKKFVPG